MSQRGADFKRLGSTHFRHAVMQDENMFCLVLESRRPVLEQVELCVNSCVCGGEVVVRASFENDKILLWSGFQKYCKLTNYDCTKLNCIY